MNATPEAIEINGTRYVPESTVSKTAVEDGLKYVVVRTYTAGVHVGYLKGRLGKEVELVKSRRIWSWDGAATLSQLAMEGVTKPNNCKFTMEVGSILLTEAIEVIEASEAARSNINAVKPWKQ